MAPPRRSRSAQLPSETKRPAAATLLTQGATPGAGAARPARDAGLPALKRNGRRPAEKAIQELRALQAVTDTALSHLALDDLLHELQERVLAIMGVDSVAILLLEADEQQLTLRAARGLEEAVALRIRVPVGDGFAGRIAATRQPLIVDDLSTFPVAHPILRERLRSVAGVPLLVGEHLLGVVHVGSATPRHFTEAEVKLLEQVADRVALAIDRARLFEAEQSARRAAEREQIQWRAAMDSAPEFVITCDADLRVTYVNPAYARLRGGPADPSVSADERPARYSLLAPDGAGLFPAMQLPLRRALYEGQPVHGVVLAHRDPAGEECLVAWDAAPMRSPQGALLGAIAVGRDITERSRLEQEREEARARELALQETARRMDEFLGTAAHDLRNPVTIVKSHLQLASRRFQRMAAASATTVSRDSVRRALRDPLEQANLGVDRLVRLVALLFDVARAQSGTLELQLAPCDLTAFVREQVASQQVAEPGRALYLVVADAPPIWVLADGDRLSQVLSNYLSNAFKYSPEDQPVQVRLEVAGGDARVAVHDAGPGLPEEEQRRVWEPYHRAPGIQTQSKIAGSLGLGLHICQRIVELHHGRVGVESEVGRGSTFWFTLPLAEATA
jgi:PAS domain S-box-containing protein